MDWKEVIERWRGLPEEEQLRINLRRIPAKVARSMEFEGEPVDLAILELEMAKHEPGGAK